MKLYIDGNFIDYDRVCRDTLIKTWKLEIKRGEKFTFKGLYPIKYNFYPILKKMEEIGIIKILVKKTDAFTIEITEQKEKLIIFKYIFNLARYNFSSVEDYAEKIQQALIGKNYYFNASYYWEYSELNSLITRVSMFVMEALYTKLILEGKNPLEYTRKFPVRGYAYFSQNALPNELFEFLDDFIDEILKDRLPEDKFIETKTRIYHYFEKWKESEKW